MANNILADTSALINLQIGSKTSLKTFEKIKERLVVSRISTCEFIYGSKNNKEKEINADFLQHFITLEIDQEISKYSYSLLIKYGLKTKFSVADSLIASSAIVQNLEFWT